MSLKYNDTMTILCIIVSLKRSIFLGCEVHSGILDKLTITNARRMHFNLSTSSTLIDIKGSVLPFFFFRFIRQSVFISKRDIRILRLTNHEPAHGKFRKDSTKVCEILQSVTDLHPLDVALHFNKYNKKFVTLCDDVTRKRRERLQVFWRRETLCKYVLHVRDIFTRIARTHVFIINVITGN